MQYLPHIMQAVVEKVSAAMQARETDPFTVFFEYGIYQDVFKTVYRRKDDGQPTYPLVWLVMPYEEQEGQQNGIQAVVTCDIIIAMTTEPDYTMQQREEINFFPRIFPIYESLLLHLPKEARFVLPSADQLRRRKRILPYWGGDESGNNNVPNLSKHYVDAVQIKDLQLSVRKTNPIC